MKYCSKCKVNVHHQLKNCPLCGSYLEDELSNENFAQYEQQDKIVKYPVLKEKSRSPFVKLKINLLLLLIFALCFAINMVTTPHYLWSVYVAIAVAFAILCVFIPIGEKTKLTTQIKQDVVITSLLAVAMEFAILQGGFAWVSVEYVIPWFAVAGIVIVDFLIIFKRKIDKQLFTTLIFASICALCPQIAFWIASLFGIATKTNICIAVFIASLFNVLLMCLLFSKSAREEFERNFNV